MTKKIWIIAASIVLFLCGCSTNQISTQTGAQQFSNAIVEAKGKCQTTFEKWKEDNLYIKVTFDAHFNAKLNSCLVEYQTDTSTATSYKIIDIFDNDVALLELDLENGKDPIVPAGQFLYERGKEIKTIDPSKEYWKRLSDMFEHDYNI